ncbi:MAG: LysM peptidoglycan-binding domain-containing protein [Flavobacteriales bacterium]|nr:LysM peptidoglycan-binding domain-containing protein [Flavobacteriales bacterium]
MRQSFLIFCVVAGFVLNSSAQVADSLKLFDRYVAPDLQSLNEVWEIQRSRILHPYKAPRNLETDHEKNIQRLDEMEVNAAAQAMASAFISSFVTDNHDATEMLVSLGSEYVPMIGEELERAGLPVEWAWLAGALSAFNADKVSSEGLVGMWQLSFPVARRFGLRIDDHIDERRDPELATRAAVRYLKYLLELFPGQEQALAAWMSSPSEVRRRLNRQPNDQFSFPVSFSPELQARWYAYLALRCIATHQKAYRVSELKMDIPDRKDTVSVAEAVSLQQPAHFLNVPVERLQSMNRACVKGWVPSGYPIYIPHPYKVRFDAARDSILTYRDSLTTHPDSMFANKLRKPKDEVRPETSIPDETAEVYYRVKSGDNLGFIASWFDVRVSSLKSWNDISNDVIQVGEDMVIYVPKDKEDYYKVVDDLSFSDKQARIGKTPPAREKEEAKPKETPVSKPPSGSYTTYTVKKGDSLWGIARKYPGVTEQDLMRWNNIDSNIQPGQVIKVYNP